MRQNMKKVTILNYFPQKENLTEISILSIYEVVIYVVIFSICLWLYFSWTDVPQKNIDIRAERIDTLINYLPDDYSSNTVSGKPSLRTAGVIHITIQNHGMVFKGDVLDSAYPAGDYIR